MLHPLFRPSSYRRMEFFLFAVIALGSFQLPGAAYEVEWNSVSTTVAQQTGSDRETEAIHDALRSVRDKLISSINAKKVDDLLSVLHPQFVLTAQDGKELKTIRGHDGMRDYLDRLLLGKSRGVESMSIDPKTDDLSILYHGNTAIAFGSSKDHYRLVDGTAFDLDTRWSATVVKEGDRWLVASLHVSTNLFKNPLLDGATSMGWWIGIGSSIGGLLLGWLLARASAKPKS